MPRITLNAHDGFPLAAWHEPAREARRGGLVICHALWGVTPHLKALAAEWAGEGYEVIIPSLLDRQDPEGAFPARDTDEALLPVRLAAAEAVGLGRECWRDVQAAIDAMAGPVFLMGFCFGGTVAWVSSARCLGVTAVACFYGGGIAENVDETPACPVILHFGKGDELIPPADVETVRERHPDRPIYLYDAGHAFVAPSGYHADAARLALLRTRAFFHQASGTKEAGA